MAFNKKNTSRQTIRADRNSLAARRSDRCRTRRVSPLLRFRRSQMRSAAGRCGPRHRTLKERPGAVPSGAGAARDRAQTLYRRERVQRCMDGIRSSVLTAFYTPPVFVRAIADTIYRTGDISAERMLDPSAGTGVFRRGVQRGEGTSGRNGTVSRRTRSRAPSSANSSPAMKLHTDSFHSHQ